MISNRLASPHTFTLMYDTAGGGWICEIVHEGARVHTVSGVEAADVALRSAMRWADENSIRFTKDQPR